MPTPAMYKSFAGRVTCEHAGCGPAHKDQTLDDTESLALSEHADTLGTDPMADALITNSITEQNPGATALGEIRRVEAYSRRHHVEDASIGGADTTTYMMLMQWLACGSGHPASSCALAPYSVTGWVARHWAHGFCCGQHGLGTASG